MRTFKGQAVTRDETSPTDYPYDRILDAVPGVSSGTPGEEKTFGDLLQGFYEMLRLAGITPDETPEKKGDSQFADAVLAMQPVAILRCGWDDTLSAIGLLGGKYVDGYSAAFVETSVSGTTAVLCKLTIKKDGVLSTENYFVTVSSAYGLAAPINGTQHGYNATSPNDGMHFKNDTASNVIVGDPDSSAIADLRTRTQLIINVYKA